MCEIFLINIVYGQELQQTLRRTSPEKTTLRHLLTEIREVKPTLHQREQLLIIIVDLLPETMAVRTHEKDIFEVPGKRKISGKKGVLWAGTWWSG